jgi:hypothetical protein
VCRRIFRQQSHVQNLRSPVKYIKVVEELQNKTAKLSATQRNKLEVFGRNQIHEIASRERAVM